MPLKTGEKPARQRLAPDARQQQILEGAIAYFAEFGFEGGTRELARHLGISQALLFRYFPSKAALVDRVYEVVFLSRWHPAWRRLLTDRSTPLPERLKTFYKDYNRSIDRYEVIRISLFSALRNESISQRYVARIREQLMVPIAEEFRFTLGLASPSTLPILPLEEQLVLGLHATVIYGIMRKHVFHAAPPTDDEFLIDLYVDGFVSHAATSFERVIARAGETGGAQTWAPPGLAARL